MGDDKLGNLEKGAAVLGLGWRAYIKFREWRAKAAEAKAAAALVKLNLANARAAARIALKLEQARRDEAELRERWKGDAP